MLFLLQGPGEQGSLERAGGGGGGGGGELAESLGSKEVDRVGRFSYVYESEMFHEFLSPWFNREADRCDCHVASIMCPFFEDHEVSFTTEPAGCPLHRCS